MILFWTGIFLRPNLWSFFCHNISPRNWIIIPPGIFFDQDAPEFWNYAVFVDTLSARCASVLFSCFVFGPNRPPHHWWVCRVQESSKARGSGSRLHLIQEWPAAGKVWRVFFEGSFRLLDPLQESVQGEGTPIHFFLCFLCVFDFGTLRFFCVFFSLAISQFSDSVDFFLLGYFFRPWKTSYSGPIFPCGEICFVEILDIFGPFWPTNCSIWGFWRSQNLINMNQLLAAWPKSSPAEKCTSGGTWRN